MQHPTSSERMGVVQSHHPSSPASPSATSSSRPTGHTFQPPPPVRAPTQPPKPSFAPPGPVQYQHPPQQTPRFPPPSPAPVPLSPFPYPHDADPYYTHNQYPPPLGAYRATSRLSTPAPSSVRVDSYRPEGSVGPRSAQDVYKEERERTMTKSDRIMNKLWEITTQLTTQQADIAGLKNDNRQLRDQIHELQLGQRALASKDEITEEISNQITPTLTEQLQTYTDSLNTVRAELPEKFAAASARQLKDALTSVRPSQPPAPELPAQGPMTNLVNHVIIKLDTLDKISNSLATLSDLGDAIRDLGVFSVAVRAAEDKAKNGPIPTPDATPQNQNGVDVGMRDASVSHSRLPADIINDFRQAVETLNTRLGSIATKEQCEQLNGMIKGVGDAQAALFHQILLRQPMFYPSPQQPQSIPAPQSSYLPTPAGSSHRAQTSQLDILAQAASQSTPFRERSSEVVSTVLQPTQTDRRLSQPNSAEGVPERNVDVFGPIINIPPTRSSKTKPPAKGKSKSKSKRNPSNVQRKKRSAHNLPSSLLKATERELTPSPDRPITRSMSTTTQPRLAQAYSTQGSSKDEPIEMSSGSGSSGSHQSQPTALPAGENGIAVKAKARPAPNIARHSITPPNNPNTTGDLTSQPLERSLPSQPKRPSAPLRTYSSSSSQSTPRAGSSLFGSTSGIPPSRKMMAMGARKEGKQERLRSRGWGGAGEDSERRLLAFNEDEDESMN